MENVKEPSIYYVAAGTYSTSEEEGIHILRFNAQTGELTKLASSAGIENSSFLVSHPRKNLLFATSEVGYGVVVSYRFDPQAGNLQEINRQSTKGDSPCYISIDATGEWLFTVNYTSGSICLFPVRPDGAIDALADLVQLEGHSVHPRRQTKPHPHSVVQLPGTCFWLVPDLGVDRLYVYALDTGEGKLRPQGFIDTEPGSGPRHIAFHPHRHLLYCIEELSSNITVYSYDLNDGVLASVQTISALPHDFQGESACADIHVTPSGKLLYASNRGHDSIAVFRIQNNGALQSVGHFESLGRTPRNFTLVSDEDCILVANQESDSIAVFKQSKNGLPSYASQALSIKAPVCLKLLS